MNPHDPSTFDEDLEIVLAHIIQDFMSYMKQQGFSTPKINALMYIYHTGECSVSDIGALTDTSNAAASQLVERLVGQDLVDRRESPTNRRSKVLKLTEKGNELIRDSVPSNHFLKNLIASLTADQRETVQDAFSILAQAAQQNQPANKSMDGNRA